MTGNGRNRPGALAATPRRYLAIACRAGAMTLFVVIALHVSGVADAAPAPSCPGGAVTLVSPGQRVVEEVGVDMSASTAGSVLRAPYVASTDGVVARSAAEGALLRVVPFGPSGVGAQPVFLGSFALAGDDELFNVASSNRLRCVAQRHVASLATVKIDRRDLGSDVAGFVRSAILHGRSMVAAKGRVTVTVLTDGCEAPATVGLNRRLTDVCGMLAAGRSVREIVREHAEEFGLPDASGVTIVMRGIGVGRRPSSASTALAERLIEFWGLVCRSAHAAACEIGSDLP